MLLRFRVKNYRSLRDHQELSLIAGPYRELPSGAKEIPSLNLSVLQVIGIYGANASGKSNLLKALHFMESAIRLSHRNWDPEGPIPYEPFLIDPRTASAPSLFEVEFVIDDVRYDYGFTNTSERICEEWLFAYPKGKKQVWFTRDKDRKTEFSFGKSLQGENKAVEAVTRKNSLFLSAAAQNNHVLLSPVYQWFVRRIQVATVENRPSRTRYTAQMLESEQVRAAFVTILKAADLGIVGVDLRYEDYALEQRHLLDKLPKPTATPKGFTPTRPIISLRHSAEGNRDGVSFKLEHESYGTQTFLALVGPVLDALVSGETLLVDELDASLHTRLAEVIVKMFNNSELNRKGAQIIFNTHDTNLLSQDLLRRDQVWFTEKDDSGATHVYPLSDFAARKQENLEKGYLQGRFGAVPFIAPPSLIGNLS